MGVLIGNMLLILHLILMDKIKITLNTRYTIYS